MEVPTVKAIVTGGASGLGRATAARVIAGGGRVAIFDLARSPGAEVARSARGSGRCLAHRSGRPEFTQGPSRSRCMVSSATVTSAATDGAGNVFLVGGSDSAGLDFGGGPLPAGSFVAKLDAAGNFVFSRWFTSTVEVNAAYSYRGPQGWVATDAAQLITVRSVTSKRTATSWLRMSCGPTPASLALSPAKSANASLRR